MLKAKIIKNFLFLIHRKHFIVFLLCFGISSNLYAQKKSIHSQEKVDIKFGVHPLHNPQKLVELFGPLCDYLTRHSKSFRCQLEPSKDYPHYNERIKNEFFDVHMPNPFQAIKSQDYNYEIVGKWSNDELFKGIVLVKKTSPINKLEDLKGKKISFPAATALAAAMMPQFDLATKGLLPQKDYDAIYVGSQESSMLAVSLGNVDAGVTWIPPWNLMKKSHSQEMDQLKIIHQTQSLPNNAVVIKKSINQKIKNELLTLLFNLSESTEGKEMLKRMGVEGFEKADSKTYLPVNQFVKDFELKVSPIPW